jgi:FPC/CPF motif-containing protein YcgG
MPGITRSALSRHRSTAARAVDVVESRIGAPEYPCLGAKSVLHQSRATVRVFRELGTPETAARLLDELRRFSARTGSRGGFASFIAVFTAPEIASETQFEDLLWRELQFLHCLDTDPWATDVSHDPRDDDFAFCAGGIAYFLVGLHPRASRFARRAEYPTLVFNLHAQFEALRAAGYYERMRDAIRARDERLQGSVNPMVRDHGRSPSASQYSGREVGPGWEAPFEYHDHGARAA